MYQRILVPIDGSPTAEAGLRHAVGLAAALKAKIVLLHVMDDFALLVEMSAVANFDAMRDGLRRFGREALARAETVAADAGVTSEAIFREQPQARISAVINEEALKAGCDLIVMGTHGRRGFSRLTMGSNAEAVMRTSVVPVLLVRAGEANA